MKSAATMQECLGDFEMVWTGPTVGSVSMRRTDQALIEVVSAARQSLLVVSFAVYRVASVHEAINAAIDRGVNVCMCIESDDAGASHIRYDARRLLGDALVDRSRIYVWPEESRPTGTAGRTGVMHAKCAVADEAQLFLSSANLTQHAMDLNIELGVLVHGGPLPGRVMAQFEGLIRSRALRKIRPQRSGT